MNKIRSSLVRRVQKLRKYYKNWLAGFCHQGFTLALFRICSALLLVESKVKAAMSYIKKSKALSGHYTGSASTTKCCPSVTLSNLCRFLNLIPLIFKPMVFLITRWAPTIVVNRFIWLYKWVTGFFSPRNQWSLNLLK